MLLSIILSLLFNLQPVHDAGYRGAGIHIAVIDAGFYHVDTDTAYFPTSQIIGSYDLQDDSATFYHHADYNHGASVLSTMLTPHNDQGEPLGTAPEASYYLIRTEHLIREYKEEINLLARGIRLADSLDVDIITISLGYRTFDNPNEDLTYDSINGSSVAAQAAIEAARHGRLVCVSAGNDGNKDWHYLSTPADADSIITVGAVGADSTAAPFSSFGPTADGRLKPEISAMGLQTEIYNPTIGACTRSNGTSFACPEVAGMAACLWQAFPEWTAMELREHIIQSASHYPTWDAQIGYGIPDAWKIYQQNKPQGAVSLKSQKASARKVIREGKLLIIIDGKTYDMWGRRVQ